MATTDLLLDVSRAKVTRGGGDGAVTFDDPACPWVVQVVVTQTRRGARHRTAISRLTVTARDSASPVGAAALKRLPLAQLLHAATGTPNPTPDEAYYRMLASPRPPGRRQWDEGHWGRVLAVYRWAKQTRRPGGGYQAVADMWGVSVDPTVGRWLAEARRREAEEVEAETSVAGPRVRETATD